MIVDALAAADGRDPGCPPDYEPGSPHVARALNATRYLAKAGDIRAVRFDPARSGWVWNHIDRSDEAWIQRAMMAPVPAMHLPIPVIRLSAPEAAVVTIGPRQSDGAALPTMGPI